MSEHAAASTVDRQRQRVYEAEQRVCDQLDFASRGAQLVTVHGSTVTLAPDRRFGTLDTAQQWLDHVRSRPWFAQRWPDATASPLRLRVRRGQRRAHYESGHEGGVIAVPVPRNATGWAMRELVLLHELAHHVVAHEVEGGWPATTPVPAHGGEFAAVTLDLVDGVLGPETRLVLAAAYADGGVDVGPGTAPPAGEGAHR